MGSEHTNFPSCSPLKVIFFIYFCVPSLLSLLQCCTSRLEKSGWVILLLGVCVPFRWLVRSNASAAESQQSKEAALQLCLAHRLYVARASAQLYFSSKSVWFGFQTQIKNWSNWISQPNLPSWLSAQLAICPSGYHSWRALGRLLLHDSYNLNTKKVNLHSCMWSRTTKNTENTKIFNSPKLKTYAVMLPQKGRKVKMRHRKSAEKHWEFWFWSLTKEDKVVHYRIW